MFGEQAKRKRTGKRANPPPPKKKKPQRGTKAGVCRLPDKVALEMKNLHFLSCFLSRLYRL